MIHVIHPLCTKTNGKDQKKKKNIKRSPIERTLLYPTFKHFKLTMKMKANTRNRKPKNRQMEKELLILGHNLLASSPFETNVNTEKLAFYFLIFLIPFCLIFPSSSSFRYVFPFCSLSYVSSSNMHLYK